MRLRGIPFQRAAADNLTELAEAALMFSPSSVRLSRQNYSPLKCVEQFCCRDISTGTGHV